MKGLAFLIGAGTLPLVSCGASGTSKALASTTSAAAIDLASYTQLYQQVAGSEGFTQFVTFLKGSTWSDLYAGATQSGLGDKLTINGSVFSGITEAATKAEQSFQSMDTRYGSVGGYWASINFDPNLPVSRAAFEEGLQVLNEWASVDPKDPKAASLIGNKTKALQDAQALARVMVYNLGASVDGIFNNPGSGLALYSVAGPACLWACYYRPTNYWWGPYQPRAVLPPPAPNYGHEAWVGHSRADGYVVQLDGSGAQLASINAAAAANHEWVQTTWNNFQTQCTEYNPDAASVNPTCP